MTDKPTKNCFKCRKICYGYLCNVCSR